MKKLVQLATTVALALLVALPATAQESGFAPSLIIGGDAFLDFRKVADAADDEDRAQIVRLAPTVLFEIAENLYVGGSFTLEDFDTEDGVDYCIDPGFQYLFGNFAVGGGLSCVQDDVAPRAFGAYLSPLGGSDQVYLRTAFDWRVLPSPLGDDGEDGSAYGFSVGLQVFLNK